jgi:hypothetical protein
LTEYLRRKAGTWGEDFMQRVARANHGDCRIVTRPP